MCAACCKALNTCSDHVWEKSNTDGKEVLVSVKEQGKEKRSLPSSRKNGKYHTHFWKETCLSSLYTCLVKSKAKPDAMVGSL